MAISMVVKRDISYIAYQYTKMNEEKKRQKIKLRIEKGNIKYALNFLYLYLFLLCMIRIKQEENDSFFSTDASSSSV